MAAAPIDRHPVLLLIVDWLQADALVRRVVTRKVRVDHGERLGGAGIWALLDLHLPLT